MASSVHTWGSLQNSSGCPGDVSNKLHIREFAHMYHVLHVHKERTGALELTYSGDKFVAGSELYTFLDFWEVRVINSN